MRIQRTAVTRAASRRAAAVIALAFAISALTASAASAFLFQAESYPAEGVGKNTNTHVFHVEGGRVECTEVKFTGALSGASETLRAKAEYKNCTAFGIVGATVSMEGCEYEFHVSSEDSSEHFLGWDALVNSSGKSCEEKPAKITSGSCVVTNQPQTDLLTVSYNNLNGSAWSKTTSPWTEVESSSVIKGATYTEGEGCLKPGTHTNGEYTGATLVKIFKSEKQIGGRIFNGL